MNRVYIVEDDDSICQLVLYALKNSGYEAMGFPSGSDFFATANQNPPELLLLDIMLPDMDGMEILKRVRRSPFSHIPVMMLTAKGSEFDKVSALDSGADDYLTKPFGVMELLSRIRALMRRASAPAPAISIEEPPLCCGPITLDRQKREVRCGDNEIVLTYKEFELLSHLLRNQDMALSRDQLMQAVWGFDFEGETRTVDMHIKQLRHKLGDFGSMIQTVRGVGYKLEAER